MADGAKLQHKVIVGGPLTVEMELDRWTADGWTIASSFGFGYTVRDDAHGVERVGVILQRVFLDATKDE